MTASGPDFRALGRRGGLATASRHDMRAVAANARRRAPSSVEYFFPLVDPDGTLDKSDREARARAAQRLHFSRMARRRSNATNAGPDQPGAVNIDSGGSSSRVRPPR